MSLAKKLTFFLCISCCISHATSASSQATNLRDLARVRPSIVGGHEVSEEDATKYRWMAGLHQPLGRVYCGGALISPTFVVTAAHCVFKETPPDVVVIGDRDVKGQAPTRQELQVQKVIVHPSYKEKTVQNDIALLKLKTPVENVDPILLVYQPESEADNIDVQVIGWGTVRSGGKRTPDILRHVTVPTVSLKQCTSPGSYKPKFIKPTNICAGFENGGKDSCQGDSGGPLFHETEEGDQQLIGVVSWGEGCADPKKYGVYTRISKYMPWIQKLVPDLPVRPIPTASPSAPLPSDPKFQRELRICSRKKTKRECDRVRPKTRCFFEFNTCMTSMIHDPEFSRTPTSFPTAAPTFPPTNYPTASPVEMGYGSDHSSYYSSEYVSDYCAKLSKKNCKNDGYCRWVPGLTECVSRY